MLAEIFFLRLESLARAAEGAAQTKNSRFVPLPRTALVGPGERRAREAEKNV